MSIYTVLGWIFQPINAGIDLLETAYAKFGLSLFAVFIAMVSFNYLNRSIFRNFL